MISGDNHSYTASDLTREISPSPDPAVNGASLPVTSEVIALRKENSHLQSSFSKLQKELVQKSTELRELSTRFEQDRKELFTELGAMRQRLRDAEIKLLLANDKLERNNAVTAVPAPPLQESDILAQGIKKELEALCENAWGVAQKLGCGTKKLDWSRSSPPKLFTFMKNILTSFEEEVLSGREKRKRQREEIEAKTTELDSAQGTNKTLSGQLQESKRQLEEARNRVSHLGSSLLELSRAQEELKTLKGTNESLTRELREKENELKKLTEELRGSRAEVQGLKDNRSRRDQLLEQLVAERRAAPAQAPAPPPPPAQVSLSDALGTPAKDIAKYLRERSTDKNIVTNLLQMDGRAGKVNSALAKIRAAQEVIAEQGEEALESPEFIELDTAEKDLSALVTNAINSTGAIDLIFEFSPGEAGQFISNLDPRLQKQVLLALLNDPSRVHAIHSDFFFYGVDTLDSRIRAALADSCRSPQDALRVFFGGAAIRSAVDGLTGIMTEEGASRAAVDPADARQVFAELMQPESGADEKLIAKFHKAIESMDFVRFVSDQTLEELRAEFFASPEKQKKARDILMGINPLIALTFVQPNPYQGKPLLYLKKTS